MSAEGAAKTSNVSHMPVDHPLRNLYRALSGLAGLLITVFGIQAYLETKDLAAFERDGERVWGITTNPAFAIVSIIVGVIIVAVVLMGNNLSAQILVIIGALYLVAGIAMLCVIRTDVNIFASSVTNANVSFIVGMLLFTAGLYGRVRR